MMRPAGEDRRIVSTDCFFAPSIMISLGPGDGSAAQARSGGGEHLVPGGFRDELVEGLADDRSRGAALRRGPDVGIPRVICVFDPAIRIAAGHPFARSPDVKSIPVATPQNRSDNDTHVS